MRSSRELSPSVGSVSSGQIDLLLDICDRLSDEGDRVYLGSTNDADHLKRIAQQLSEGDVTGELLAALKGVVRVADRQTDEFDAARAAIAKATPNSDSGG